MAAPQAEQPGHPARKYSPFAALAPAALLGVVWFCNEWRKDPSLVSLQATDLGLLYLPPTVFGLFFALCLTRSRTPARVWSAALPFLASYYLALQIMPFEFYADSPLDFATVRHHLNMIFSLLALLLTWIALFPMPRLPRTTPPPSATTWKRIEWSAAALLAAALIASWWYLLGAFHVVPTPLVHQIYLLQFAQRTIQFFVLCFYLLVLFRGAAYFDLERAAETQSKA